MKRFNYKLAVRAAVWYAVCTPLCVLANIGEKCDEMIDKLDDVLPRHTEDTWFID